jgi:hypothetical protein
MPAWAASAARFSAPLARAVKRETFPQGNAGGSAAICCSGQFTAITAGQTGNVSTMCVGAAFSLSGPAHASYPRSVRLVFR